MAKNKDLNDFSKIVLYEYEDDTSGSKELACVAGVCEIDPMMAPVSEAGK